MEKDSILASDRLQDSPRELLFTSLYREGEFFQAPLQFASIDDSFLAEGILFGFGGNKMAQLGQGHQKPVVAKPVQVVVC